MGKKLGGGGRQIYCGAIYWIWSLLELGILWRVSLWRLFNEGLRADSTYIVYIIRTLDNTTYVRQDAYIGIC